MYRFQWLKLIIIWVIIHLFSVLALAEEIEFIMGNDERPMVLIPGGTFVMGDNKQEEDERPAHAVYLSKYYIDQYEVTVADYQKFISETNKEIPKHGGGIIPILNQIPLFFKESDAWLIYNKDLVLSSGGFRNFIRSMDYDPIKWTSGNEDEEPAYLSKKDAEYVISVHPDYRMEKSEDLWVFNVNPDYPIFSVNWYQANEYCRYYGKRLPTEAEWEFAARGGSPDAFYPWGNEDPTGKSIFKPKDIIRTRPEIVGSLQPNGYQLYDMAGNVWEWIADWYEADYYQQTYKEGQKIVNPYNNAKTGQKVIRGGGWTSEAEDLRITNRNRLALKKNKLNVGFRCALSYSRR